MAGPSVAIVDYGLGNLFSVKSAVEHCGIPADITTCAEIVRAAPGVILPGVGAFGDAMGALRERGLAEVLQEVACDGRPFMGICLGLQLLMTRSYEFGTHEGLGLVPGEVRRLDPSSESGPEPKVPCVGWASLSPAAESNTAWTTSLLRRNDPGTYMYFVHSYYAAPEDPSVVLATSRYGDAEYCSALQIGSLFACQFHPERSGPHGLNIYREFASLVRAA